MVQGYSIAFGARFLKRFIDEQIKLPISAQWKAGTHFDVTVKDGEHGRRTGVGDGHGRRHARLTATCVKALGASANPTCRTWSLNRGEPLSRDATVPRCLRPLARRQPVAILQHPHHPLHLLPVFLRRVLLHVQLLVARQPRGKSRSRNFMKCARVPSSRNITLQPTKRAP